MRANIPSTAPKYQVEIAAGSAPNAADTTTLDTPPARVAMSFWCCNANRSPASGLLPAGGPGWARRDLRAGGDRRAGGPGCASGDDTITPLHRVAIRERRHG